MATISADQATEPLLTTTALLRRKIRDILNDPDNGHVVPYSVYITGYGWQGIFALAAESFSSNPNNPPLVETLAQEPAGFVRLSRAVAKAAGRI